jgi:hypothetical protein
VLLSFSSEAGDYDDCILENMKNVSDKTAANQIMRACARKALPHTPAKCKRPEPAGGKQVGIGYFDHLYPEDAANDGAPPDYASRFAATAIWTPIDIDCVAECRNASWWDKNFGECKP